MGKPGEAEHRSQLQGALIAHALLDHLMRLQQQRRRDRQAESLGGLEIDDRPLSRYAPYTTRTILVQIRHFSTVRRL